MRWVSFSLLFIAIGSFRYLVNAFHSKVIAAMLPSFHLNASKLVVHFATTRLAGLQVQSRAGPSLFHIVFSCLQMLNGHSSPAASLVIRTMSTPSFLPAPTAVKHFAVPVCVCVCLRVFVCVGQDRESRQTWEERREQEYHCDRMEKHLLDFFCSTNTGCEGMARRSFRSEEYSVTRRRFGVTLLFSVRAWMVTCQVRSVSNQCCTK